MAVGASWPFMQVELLARQRNGGDVRKWNQTLRDSSCSNTTRIGNHNRKERVNFFQKTKKIMDQKQIYVSFLLQLLALRPVVQFPVTTHRRRHAGRLQSFVRANGRSNNVQNA